MKVYRVELRGGKEFRCIVCGTGTRFTQHEVSLGPGPGVASFMFPGIQGLSVMGALCIECGYIHLFDYQMLTWNPL